MNKVSLQEKLRFPSIIANRLLVKTDGNFVFSPMGLCRALEMIQKGMEKNGSLYKKVEELICGFKGGIEPFDDEDFKLEHASSIWCNRTIRTIKDEYLRILESEYDAQVHHTDFLEIEKTKREIDKWVSDSTHEMIKALEAEISKDAMMLVLDAIYMKGSWESPFDPDLTEKGAFHNADGTEADVDMMNQYIRNAAYKETKNYKLVNLPYSNSEYSMVIVLPKGKTTIESIMGRAGWLNCTTRIHDVELYMPRFKFDNNLPFKELLIKLGLGDLFDRNDTLPNITDYPAHISQIQQQCVINVEEEGTEAAALTDIECVVGCPPPDLLLKVATMRIDRPFGFAIKGKNAQILFMGVVKNIKVNRQ